MKTRYLFLTFADEFLAHCSPGDREKHDVISNFQMSCRGALICPTVLLVWQRPSETCEKQILVSKFCIISFSKFVRLSVRAVTIFMFIDLYGKTNDALIFSLVPGKYFDKIYFNFYKFEETAAWSDTHQGPLRIPRTETSHYIFQTKSQNLCHQIQKKVPKIKLNSLNVLLN